MNLEAIILEEIKQSAAGRISFDRWMDLALYHPDYGYYTSGKVEIGSKGDFFTSSSLGADFGQLLAEQFVEMAAFLGNSRRIYFSGSGSRFGNFSERYPLII
jgi:SAM-dependent MidA family methyltransferase